VRSPAEPRRRWRVGAVLVAALASSGACASADGADDRPVVEVFGPIVDDAGAVLAGVLDEASADAPVALRYVGVTSFNEQLEDRLERGDRPAIALLPQPGLLDELQARGVLQPLPVDVAAAVAEQTPPNLVELVSRDGAPAAVWLTVDVKSLVWYRPVDFADRDLTVPRTLDEVAEVTEAVRAAGDGTSPWCLTMEAGASTGWVGTDWVEDYVLRRLGDEDYRRWTGGEIRFEDQPIRAVFEELDSLLRPPGTIAGGERAVLTVPWEQTADLLVDDDGPCLMAHQGDFLRRELPDDVRIGPDGDVDVFPLPAGDGPAPLIVGGLLAVSLDDSGTTAEAMAILAGDDVAERLDATDEFVSPHLDIEREETDQFTVRLLDLLDASAQLQFDGSDLMPPSVGTGTFWSGMRSFFAGDDLDIVVAAIDAGWPEPTAE
jgi:alpha-glucoside transport system substrate-binding protein